jgi:GNAT superfamily N-acetyltransferase
MVEIIEINSGQLDTYAKIPISFSVSSILRVELIQNGLGGILLHEEATKIPYIKDYDKTTEGGPIEWASHFDIQNWGLLLAIENLTPLAAAAVAFNTNGVNMLEERNDLSVLWDIRVHPDERGLGIGKALFTYACNWSRIRGCRQMKIETQNINTVACHFYQHMGCNLGSIHRYAYCHEPEIAHEVMLNWFIEL